ncbi:MAG TPA: hypothetical protein EYP68_07975 [Candidatus Korarchaeota archaeon]|nr:hypothetical protein [Candidatus Korarchaeota archaeon]
MQGICRTEEDLNPKTCEILWNSLSLKGIARLWVDEVYFSIGLKVELENTAQDVEVGDVVLWP